MLNTEERISRARIQLQKQNSFWAYLSLFLKFKECKKGEMPEDTMGIDPRGNVHYVKEFIDKISDDELIGLITHEVCHIVFLTQLRQGDRDPIGWNFSTDLTINTILKNNNFSLPKGGVIPDYNNELNLGFKIIKDCDKKIAEEIYDELPKIKMKRNIYTIGDGKNKGKELGKAIDVHLKGKGKDGKGKDGEQLSPNEKRALEKEWNRRVQEALTVSRLKGDIPAGLERLCEKLHKEQIDWKVLLSNFITNQIPYDFSYCVDKNTLINTPKGKVKIKDLKINQEIYGLKKGEIILNKVKEKLKSNVKEKFVIYTKSGKKLICSGKHKILTPKGYKKAKDLKVGEICITI